jgi:hypothetical protein
LFVDLPTKPLEELPNENKAIEQLQQVQDLSAIQTACRGMVRDLVFKRGDKPLNHQAVSGLIKVWLEAMKMTREIKGYKPGEGDSGDTGSSIADVLAKVEQAERALAEMDVEV